MSTAQTWHDHNRQRLLLALHDVRAALARYVGAGVDDIAAEPDDAAAETAASDELFALDLVVQRFGLSPFERDVLLLAAGPELDGQFEALLAAARGHPTFSLALAALPGAHWSACTPAGPLRRWSLIELLPSDSLMTARLRIDERVLNYLVGTPHADERLRGTVEHVTTRGSLPAARASVAADLVQRWRRGPERELDLLVLHGADQELRRTLATTVAAQAGIRVLSVRSDAVPHAPDQRVDWLRLLERECVLTDAALLFELVDSTDAGAERAVTHALESLAVPVIVSGAQPPVIAGRRLVVSEVTPLSHVELSAAWRSALGPHAPQLNGTLDRVAGQFRIGLGAIAAVGSAARATAAVADAELWQLCRTFARPRLDNLAQRIEPAAHWDDLVLPPTQLDILHSIALHVRHRVTVQHEWGFDEYGGRGLGISALFSGPSGTGKTMAAEVLAHELQLDLYRIDLSQVVSKYIGETEKNLRRVFDAAEGGAAILLFDEADALFGKRTDVKDSHDRYANIEVSYLLQRMEAYHGLAVLTTNQPSAIDAAFLRRLRFAVTFPFPDTSARTQIWQRAFPPRAPTDGVDPQRLARLSVAGGNIRNIALHAAYYAAAAGEPVRMPHLLRAARLEYAKLERPLTDAEIGGWS